MCASKCSDCHHNRSGKNGSRRCIAPTDHRQTEHDRTKSAKNGVGGVGGSTGDQHWRTKECGRRGSCSYAHSATDLRHRPDLTKTKLCDLYMKGRCVDSHCKWAHGRHELRFTNDFYKTSLCKYWVESVCYASDACRHAHGTADLRPRKYSPDLPVRPTVGERKTSALSSSRLLQEEKQTEEIPNESCQSIVEPTARGADDLLEEGANHWESETLRLLSSRPTNSSGEFSMWKPQIPLPPPPTCSHVPFTSSGQSIPEPLTDGIWADEIKYINESKETREDFIWDYDEILSDIKEMTFRRMSWVSTADTSGSPRISPYSNEYRSHELDEHEMLCPLLPTEIITVLGLSDIPKSEQSRQNVSHVVSFSPKLEPSYPRRHTEEPVMCRIEEKACDDEERSVSRRPWPSWESRDIGTTTFGLSAHITDTSISDDRGTRCLRIKNYVLKHNEP